MATPTASDPPATGTGPAGRIVAEVASPAISESAGAESAKTKPAESEWPGRDAISILVIDVGTSSVRAAIVRPDATVEHVHRRPLPPHVPMPGLVEFDPAAMAERGHRGGPGDHALAGGGAASRPSASPPSGRPPSPGTAAPAHPLGPGLGWQDLRTVGTCLELQAEGMRFSPASRPPSSPGCSTRSTRPTPAGARQARARSTAGWPGSSARARSTSPMPATPRSTGLYRLDGHRLAPGGPRTARLPAHGPARQSSTRPGSRARPPPCPAARPCCALVGDQQASLMGRAAPGPGWPRPPSGPGAMLDVCVGDTRPGFRPPGRGGLLPDRRLAAPRRARPGGSEAIMLAAGTAVDWLVEDLGLIASAGESEAVAARVRRHRRRGGGPRPARLRHPAVGFRRPRRPLRAHPGHGPARGGPGRARRRRPLRRRPARGGRARRRPGQSATCASTAA